MKYPLFAVLLGFAYMAAEEESEEEHDLAAMLQTFPAVAANWDAFVMALPTSYDLTPAKVAAALDDMVRPQDRGHWPET